MPKRFSRLKYALTTLRTPTGTGATPDAPTGTIARKFQDYKAGKVRLAYPRADDDSNPGQILRTSVLPFYSGGAANSELIVALSKRASAASVVDTIQAQCNQITPNYETHGRNSRFRPAKITVRKKGAARTSAPSSQITGIKYSKDKYSSYTLPFGASASEKTEGEVRKGLLAALVDMTGATVSFQSERF